MEIMLRGLPPDVANVCVCVCVCFAVNSLRPRWSGPSSWRRNSATTTLSCRSGERLSNHQSCCWIRYVDTKRGLQKVQP